MFAPFAFLNQSIPEELTYLMAVSNRNSPTGNVFGVRSKELGQPWTSMAGVGGMFLTEFKGWYYSQGSSANDGLNRRSVRRTQDFVTWQTVIPDPTVGVFYNKLTVIGDRMFAICENATITSQPLVRYTDDGVTWSNVAGLNSNTSANQKSVAIASNGSIYLVIVLSGTAVSYYTSTNNGVNWTARTMTGTAITGIDWITYQGGNWIVGGTSIKSSLAKILTVPATGNLTYVDNSYIGYSHEPIFHDGFYYSSYNESGFLYFIKSTLTSSTKNNSSYPGFISKSAICRGSLIIGDYFVTTCNQGIAYINYKTFTTTTPWTTVPELISGTSNVLTDLVLIKGTY